MREGEAGQHRAGARRHSYEPCWRPEGKKTAKVSKTKRPTAACSAAATGGPSAAKTLNICCCKSKMAADRAGLEA